MRPRVLDAEGRELRDGAQVERYWSSEKRGCVVGTVLAVTKLDVLVQWPSGRSFYNPNPRHSLLGRTFVCSDLVVAGPERAKGKGAGDE